MKKRSKRLALSTGQVARYCYVSSDTILKLINSDQLRAQRTVGGQYRITIEDLKRFMIEHGMRTELLDAEEGIRPFCWEFHCNAGAGDPSPEDAKCRHCIAYRTGALNCFELRDMIPRDLVRCPDCKQCEYFNSWVGDQSKLEEIGNAKSFGV